jgi:hypothetical protein
MAAMICCCLLLRPSSYGGLLHPFLLLLAANYSAYVRQQQAWHGSHDLLLLPIFAV